MLLLDDEPLLRAVVDHLAASRPDVHLEAVATPSELRARLRAAARDLVVCDWHLPRGTTRDLVLELARAGVAVIVWTSDVAGAEAALGTGVRVFDKSASLDVLVAEARRRRALS